MSTLGVVETLSMDSAFTSETTKPAVPGAERTSPAGPRPWRSRRQGLDSSLSAAIQETLDATLRTAEASLEKINSSTTLAALAQARESVGDKDAAIEAARDTLRRCELESTREILSDPVSVRLAIEVLLRAGDISSVVEAAGNLPLSPRLRLEIGATLAGAGRFDEARPYIDAADVAERSSVLGFLLLMEEKYAAAVPHLRAALRDDPADADSALNLSIALWHLDSRRKALSAARRAFNSAPGREDVFTHLMEMLLSENEFVQVDRETQHRFDIGVLPSSRLLILQARAKLSMQEVDRGIRLLEQACAMASEEGDEDTVAEVRSNLIRIKVQTKKLGRDEAIRQLLDLHRKNPTIDVVGVTLAQVASRKSHAAALEGVYERVLSHTTDERAAFLRYQIATLVGDNARAAELALAWVRLEPNNSSALIAVMVALGIGEERWAEASEFAFQVVRSGKNDPSEMNNAAYVLAMAGMGARAVELLRPAADAGFVLKATLGLAYLSVGDIEQGMRLYRRAADEADRHADDSRSLMTAYQALVVRQLRLLESSDPGMVSALSLPPVALPDDWQDRPEFLRLHAVAQRHGFSWPLSL